MTSSSSGNLEGSTSSSNAFTSNSEQRMPPTSLANSQMNSLLGGRVSVSLGSFLNNSVCPIRFDNIRLNNVIDVAGVRARSAAYC